MAGGGEPGSPDHPAGRHRSTSLEYPYVLPPPRPRCGSVSDHRAMRGLSPERYGRAVGRRSPETPPKHYGSDLLLGPKGPPHGPGGGSGELYPPRHHHRSSLSEPRHPEGGASPETQRHLYALSPDHHGKHGPPPGRGGARRGGAAEEQSPHHRGVYNGMNGSVDIRKQIDAAEAGLASWLRVLYRSNGDGLRLLAVPRHEVKACHSGA
ncbi:unnamed protein product [Arctogadus glacialis]